MVQELKTSMTIGDTGRGSLTTSTIKGALSCFIISTSSPVKLSIVLENYPAIGILDLASCNGVKYFPVEIQPLDKNGDLINYRSSKYYLNDKLVIEAAGVRNSKVDITIRYG